ncbi:hypothetical protein C8J57DRAFT_1321978 [Mycena rebaudengoi]|nr:hypothetical protein C8J57DRAFT_1321978 [Mycena rebaudengoi]
MLLACANLAIPPPRRHASGTGTRSARGCRHASRHSRTPRTPSSAHTSSFCAIWGYMIWHMCRQLPLPLQLRLLRIGSGITRRRTTRLQRLARGVVRERNPQAATDPQPTDSPRDASPIIQLLPRPSAEKPTTPPLLYQAHRSVRSQIVRHSILFLSSIHIRCYDLRHPNPHPTAPPPTLPRRSHKASNPSKPKPTPILLALLAARTSHRHRVRRNTDAFGARLPEVLLGSDGYDFELPESVLSERPVVAGKAQADTETKEAVGGAEAEAGEEKEKVDEGEEV